MKGGTVPVPPFFLTARQEPSRSQPTVRQPSRIWRTATALAALVALNVLVYGAVIGYDFVNLDDPDYVTANPHVAAGLTWSGISWAFTTGTAGNWHPLTWLSHMVDVQLYGLNAGGHHLTSLLLHIVNTLLLFGVLRRMTDACGRSLFVAALFAVHPLHVESVAWVAERKDVLSTFFLMLAIWSYVSYVRRPTLGRHVPVVLCFALGLLAKPMLVTLPFLLLLLDLWPLRRVTLMPFTVSAWRPLVREKILLFAMAVAHSVITFSTQHQVGTMSSLDRLPLTARVAHALASYVAYLGQMLWPARLAAFYPYPETAPSALEATLAALLIVGVSVTVLRLARRHSYLATGWFWFIGMLVPVIGLVQVGNQSTADRYTYVPLIGLFLIAAWAVPHLLSRRSYARAAVPGIAVAVVAACSIVARAQVGSWASSQTLWERALAVTPDNYFAHGALGAALADQGRLAESAAHLNEALRLKPNLADVHNDLGEVLARQGRLNEAITHFSEAVRIDQNSAEAHHNFGVALAGQGRTAEAVAELSAAVRLNPTLSGTHNALGKALLDQGRFAEATVHLVEAIRVMPEFADAHVNLGIALTRQGRIEDAIRELEQALRLRPDQPDVHCNLAVLFEQRGNSTQAREHLEAALAIAPAHARARRMLDDLSRRGREDQAPRAPK